MDNKEWVKSVRENLLGVYDIYGEDISYHTGVKVKNMTDDQIRHKRNQYEGEWVNVFDEVLKNRRTKKLNKIINNIK